MTLTPNTGYKTETRHRGLQLPYHLLDSTVSQINHLKWFIREGLYAKARFSALARFVDISALVEWEVGARAVYTRIY